MIAPQGFTSCRATHKSSINVNKFMTLNVFHQQRLLHNTISWIVNQIFNGLWNLKIITSINKTHRLPIAIDCEIIKRKQTSHKAILSKLSLRVISTYSTLLIFYSWTARIFDTKMMEIISVNIVYIVYPFQTTRLDKNNINIISIITKHTI